MDDALDALRARVERAELEVRLLAAMIRIRTAERLLAEARIRNEQSLGIYREHEAALPETADAPAPT